MEKHRPLPPGDIGYTISRGTYDERIKTARNGGRAAAKAKQVQKAVREKQLREEDAIKDQIAAESLLAEMKLRAKQTSPLPEDIIWDDGLPHD